MELKVAVIGAGSTYTPELIEGFAARAELLGLTELWLHDIDAERLDIVGGLARRIMDNRGFAGRLELTGDREAAVEGAGFVLVQLRVGGLAARLLDETIPPRFGCLGQETTGAGGFAKALRTVPVVLDIAADTARLGAEGAWLLDFTNPAGLVTQALADHGHRAIGLCNIPIGFQRTFADRLGVEPERVALEHVGLNHLSWERAVMVDGEDRLPGLIDVFADQLGEEVGMPGDVVRSLRALPSYYLRYFYFPRETVAELRRRGQPGGAGHGDRAGAPRDVPRPRASREAEAARGAGRSVVLGGRRDARRVAPSRPRRRPDRERPERRRHPQHRRRCRGGGAMPDHAARARSRCRRGRYLPRCSAWSSR